MRGKHESKNVHTHNNNLIEGIVKRFPNETITLNRLVTELLLDSIDNIAKPWGIKRTTVTSMLEYVRTHLPATCEQIVCGAGPHRYTIIRIKGKGDNGQA